MLGSRQDFLEAHSQCPKRQSNMAMKLEESGKRRLGHGNGVLKRWIAQKDATEVNSVVRGAAAERPAWRMGGGEEKMGRKTRYGGRCCDVMSVLTLVHDSPMSTATKLAHVCLGSRRQPSCSVLLAWLSDMYSTMEA